MYTMRFFAPKRNMSDNIQTDTTYNFIVALAFLQMFNLLRERADNVHGGRPLCRIKKYASWKPVPILLYFSEQANKSELTKECSSGWKKRIADAARLIPVVRPAKGN